MRTRESRGFCSGIVMGAGALFLCLLPLTLAAQTGGKSTVTETHAFAPGQRVHLEMNVGELKILRSPNEHQMQLMIQPSFDAGESTVRSWLKEFDVNGAEAHITLHMPGHSHGEHQGVTVTLYLPSEVSLDADLEVGQMTVDGLKGDKQLHVGVGELDIQGIEAHDYGQVSTTTGVGDVQDSIFDGKQSGWLGKSETAQGGGKYRVDAKVGVGSIRLRDSTAQETN